ncbi:uncharacterized protein V6R79_012855, partial [Siganus canaliculatus]
PVQPKAQGSEWSKVAALLLMFMSKSSPLLSGFGIQAVINCYSQTSFHLQLQSADFSLWIPHGSSVLTDGSKPFLLQILLISTNSVSCLCCYQVKSDAASIGINKRRLTLQLAQHQELYSHRFDVLCKDVALWMPLIVLLLLSEDEPPRSGRLTPAHAICMKVSDNGEGLEHNKKPPLISPLDITPVSGDPPKWFGTISQNSCDASLDQLQLAASSKWTQGTTKSSVGHFYLGYLIYFNDQRMDLVCKLCMWLHVSERSECVTFCCSSKTEPGERISYCNRTEPMVRQKVERIVELSSVGFLIYPRPVLHGCLSLSAAMSLLSLHHERCCAADEQLTALMILCRVDVYLSRPRSSHRLFCS